MLKKKHVLTLRVEEELVNKLKTFAEIKGYKSLNEMVNLYLEEIVKKDNSLPEVFYKPIKVKKYEKFNRDEIYNESFT
jgi:hypothetical protein